MTTWTRARGPRHLSCGNCGQVIPIGDPVFVFTIGKIEKVRCSRPTCAGAAPPDLPLEIEHREPEPTPLSFRFNALLPLDYKQRQVERKPGEDDA